jgi:glucokinase
VILAGDVGGTKTRLARFDLADGRLVEIRSRSFASADFPGLADAIRRFESLPDPSLKAAAFGVAGPVRGERVRTTNLPWEVDARDLSRSLGIPVVRLLNDLEAMALGVEALEAKDLATLQEGEPDPEGNAAVIAAGTGLGQALLIRHEGRLRASATEGGHADFAPHDDEAVEVLAALRRRFGHVSAERIVSGMGLDFLYEYNHDTARGRPSPHLEPPSEIPRLMAGAARDGTCPACRRAFSLFLGAYGAEAGNLALRAAATGGLFVGGGIAAANDDMMRDGTFLAAFRAKGRFEGWMRRVPVRVILNEATPLLGAALAAARAAGLLGD